MVQETRKSLPYQSAFDTPMQTCQPITVIKTNATVVRNILLTFLDKHTQYE